MSHQLVPFPSITDDLAHLPKATSVGSVSVYHSLNPSGHSQEAEDKLRRAIASQNQPGREKLDAFTTTASGFKSSDDAAVEDGDYITMREERKSTEFPGPGEAGSADGQGSNRTGMDGQTDGQTEGEG
ncbi:hypothetical protein FRC04_003117 [Tulasnella sp. 424]|nr:hypothetical protein FRC04_003117 [Tulasnella sp. 424]